MFWNKRQIPPNNKIAFLIPKLHGGGAERAMSYAANALCEEYSVTVIVLNRPDPPEDYYLSDRIRVIWADRYQGKTVPAYLRTVHQIRALKRRERFAVVISFLPEAHFLNIVTRCRERVYISIRNHTGLRRKYVPHDIFGPIAERLHPLADKVICVSEDVARDEAEHFHIPKEKIVVVRNGIDPDNIRAQAACENTDAAFLRFVSEHAFLFATSGRLVIQKGQWHLLRAFRELREEAPEAGLFLLGEGEIEAELRAEAARLGLGDSVFFCGRAVNPFSYLKYADVFVLSSLFEGLPNVLLEAMSMPLPIVADDCPGVREVLTPARPFTTPVTGLTEGEYGLLSPALEDDWPKDPALTVKERFLLDGMRRLYRDPALREHYRQQGEELLKQFTIPQRKAEWEALIRSAMDP